MIISKKLFQARSYEAEAEKSISAEERPVFHLSPRTGWMNDPNGFSFYKGKYHLFYQYNPYSSVWDSMHWGHAVSDDLLRWEYLPAALAPDKDYDSWGCYSGSAIELDDGRQLLLYTGVRKENTGEQNIENEKEIQLQCAAVGDGFDYEKYEKNPVIDENILPAGKNKYNFRDPKIWKETDGTYRCVVGACGNDDLGSILLYSSRDGFEWKFESVLAENDGRFGTIWECPDFFELDGKYVLLTSPVDMLPEGFEYHNGNGTLCLIGSFDKDSKKFTYEHDQSIDYGIDFYAAQTLLAPDGRRIMVGWMQNWDTCKLIGTHKRPWFGQMSIPRELSVKNGRLYQQPVRELEKYRSGKTEYKNVAVNGEIALDGIKGRTVDIEMRIRPADPEKAFIKFAVRFAKNDKFFTSVSYRPHEKVLKIDRKFSGSRRAYIHQRRCLVPDKNGEVKLRLILDRFSAEVFINDGEQVMTATILTDTSADDISFISNGAAVMDITKYDLFAEV